MRTFVLLACCLCAVAGQNPDAAVELDPLRKSAWEDPIRFVTKAWDQCTMLVTGQGDLTKLRVSCQAQVRVYWCEYQGKPQVCRAYNNNPRHYFTQIMWDLRKLQHACQQGMRHIKPLMCKRASDEAQMAFSTASGPDAAPRDRPAAKAPQEKPAQATPDIPKAPTPKQEVAKPTVARPEQVKPEETRPEQARPEQAKPAPEKPVQAKPEPAKPQPSRPEQVKPEPAKPEQAKPAPAKPEQARPQPAKPQPARPQPVRLQPAKPASAKPWVKTTTLKKILTPKTTGPKPTKPAAPKSEARKMAQEYCWRSMQGICAYVIGWFRN